MRSLSNRLDLARADHNRNCILVQVRRCIPRSAACLRVLLLLLSGSLPSNPHHARHIRQVGRHHNDPTHHHNPSPAWQPQLTSALTHAVLSRTPSHRSHAHACFCAPSRVQHQLRSSTSSGSSRCLLTLRAADSDNTAAGADAAQAPSPIPTQAAPQQQPTASSSSSNSSDTSSGGGGGQAGLAGGAVAAGVALFLASRLLTGGPSIAALEQEATPLDVALSNGKPTVVEFYASWWVSHTLCLRLVTKCYLGCGCVFVSLCALTGRTQCRCDYVVGCSCHTVLPRMWVCPFLGPV